MVSSSGLVYLFKELYIESIIRNPKKGRFFRLQVGFRVQSFQAGFCVGLLSGFGISG